MRLNLGPQFLTEIHAATDKMVPHIQGTWKLKVHHQQEKS
jgi:hypothetical protein